MAIRSSDQISIVDLTDGYAVNLSTDAFTFAGDTTKVKSTQSFSTTIYGYCGSKAVTAAVDTTALSLPTGVTVTSDDDTIAPTLTFTATTALTQAILTNFGGKIDIPVVLDGGDITLHKSVAIGIALTGATGTAPYSILVGNEAQVISCDKDGKTLAAGTITIPFSIFQGTTRRACTVTYSTLPSGITLNKNTDGTASAEGSLVLDVAAASNLGGANEGTITLTFKYGSTTVGTKTFTWSKSLTGATGGQGPQGNPGTNGTSATSVVCGNEAVSVPCTLDGKAKAAMTITIPFAGYIGTTRAACTVAYSTLPSGVTLGSNTPATASADGSLVFSVAANANFGSNTTYTGEITLTFSCNSQTFVKKFTWSKALTGATGGKGDKGDPGDDAITIAITSSNGTIFKNSAIATTLTAHVYQGGTELNTTQIAALGTIKWYKDGATTATATGQTLTISAGDVTNKASYIAQLEG